MQTHSITPLATVLTAARFRSPQVLLAFTATWPSDVLARLGSLSEASVTDFAALVRDLESTTHQALKASLQTHLMAPLRALLETRDEPLAALGRCWLGIAMVILQLYIPSIPIDPSAAQRAQLQLLQIEESRLSDELAAHLQAEAAITGNGANLKSAAILPRLDEIRLAIAQLGAMVVERKSDVGLLNAMFHEIHEFFNEVLAPTRMQNLVEALANAPDEQALLRERSAQENIVGFCRRLDQTYRFFADLHRPIVLALGQLRTGLRLLCRDAELKRALQAQQLEADLVPILTAFPTTLGIRTLHAADLPVRFKSHVPAVPTSSLLLLGLAASVYDNGIGITFDSGRVQAVSTLFDQFTHLWLMDCERQAQAEQEAESLYRQRKVEEDVLTDIELEEKEFKELFPQFGDVLDDDDEQDRDLSAQTKDKALKAAFIQPGQAAVALQLHGASRPNPFSSPLLVPTVRLTRRALPLLQAPSSTRRATSTGSTSTRPRARPSSGRSSSAATTRSRTTSTTRSRSRSASSSRPSPPAARSRRSPTGGRTTTTRTPTRARCARPSRC